MDIQKRHTASDPQVYHWLTARHCTVRAVHLTIAIATHSMTVIKKHFSRNHLDPGIGELDALVIDALWRHAGTALISKL